MEEKNKPIEYAMPSTDGEGIAVKVNGATVSLHNKEVTVFFRDTRQETMETTTRLWAVFAAGVSIGACLAFCFAYIAARSYFGW